MSLRYIYSGLLILFTLHALAQDGRNAYSFLEVPTSSHAFTLGGTNITIIDDDLTLVDQNPGLLGAEIESQVSFNYMHYLGSSNFA